MSKQPITEYPNWTTTQRLVVEYIQYLDGDDRNEDGAAKFDAYIAEAAVAAVFGGEIFEWINSRFEE